MGLAGVVKGNLGAQLSFSMHNIVVNIHVIQAQEAR